GCNTWCGYMLYDNGGGNPLISFNPAYLELNRPGTMYNVKAPNKTVKNMRKPVSFGRTLCLPHRSIPARYKVVSKPINTQSATKTSLFIIPHCCTLSALARNFTASPSSTKPSTTFTVVIHPPDF